MKFHLPTYQPNNYVRVLNCTLVAIMLWSIQIDANAQDINFIAIQDSTIGRVPVNAIVVDLNNNKWIGTENQFYKINNRETNIKEIKSIGVLAAVIGENERGWLCTYENKIAMFDKEVSYSTNVPSNEMITAMAMDGNFFWLGTTNGLYKISLKSRKNNKSYFENNSKLPSNRINSIVADDYGTVWIGTEKGLLEINGSRWKTHLKKEAITALAHKDGKIIVAGNGKLWRFKQKGDYEELQLPEQLSYSPIEAIAFDAADGLWIAAGVLCRLNENWIPYFFGENEGFKSVHPVSIATDQRNNIWVGTAGNGLYKFQPTNDLGNDRPMAFADRVEQKDDAPTSDNMTASILDNTPKGINEVASAIASDNADIALTDEVVDDKTIKIGQEVTVSDRKVKIAIWNANDNPNDVVSVYYKGKLVLKEHLLTLHRKVIALKISKRDANDLVIVAHSSTTGDTKEVMVALLDDDNEGSWITLKPTEQYGDKLKFVYKK